MKKNKLSFVLLLFVGYLGNVLLLSSYFDTEAAPKTILELEMDYLSQQDNCVELENTPIAQRFIKE